jgi:putative acetyltransferase
MTIRKVRQEDDRRIAEIIRDIFDDLDMPKEHTVYDEPATDHQYEVFRAEPRSVLWVAEEDGVVLGSCGAYPTEGLPEGWCEIVKFYVDKCARGKGIGTKLFTKALESARSMGYQTAYLETFPKFGNAIGLYHRLGFHDIDHQMGNSGHTAMSIFMTKRLSKTESADDRCDDEW